MVSKGRIVVDTFFTELPIGRVVHHPLLIEIVGIASIPDGLWMQQVRQCGDFGFRRGERRQRS